MKFSDKINAQLGVCRAEYYNEVHAALCSAVGASAVTHVRCQNPKLLTFKLVDENKLFDVLLKMVNLNGLLKLSPRQLFDFSFYPEGFNCDLESIEQTIDSLTESVPKYKGTLSYVFLWDILLLDACHCDLLRDELLQCLRLQIGDSYENIQHSTEVLCGSAGRAI